MTGTTVSQQDDLCREAVLKALTDSERGARISDLAQILRQSESPSVRALRTPDIRKAIVQLQDDDLIDWDQCTGSAAKLYFLAGRNVRAGVRWISAGATAPITAKGPASWLGALGAFQ